MSDMEADLPAEQMWTLSDDLETLRLQLPPLPIDGMPEPLRVHLDFDAAMVDEILQRLTVLARADVASSSAQLRGAASEARPFGLLSENARG